MDHLKSARCIQSSSYWEGEKDGNYERKLLSSHAKVWSGLRSATEPLVSTSEAGGVPDAGDVEKQETPESSLGDALEGASPSEAPLIKNRKGSN